MKINIKNNCNLPFEVIGKVLDKDIAPGYKILNYKDKQYKIEIIQNILSITVVAVELKILAKDIIVDMSDVKFPKIPKKKI